MSVDFENRKGEKGAALVLVLVIVLVLTALGMGVITSSSTNIALARNYEVSVQAQNMAETGAKVAYREFINTGFIKTTHKIGKTAAAVSDSLLSTTLLNWTYDGDGNILWQWDSSSGYDPLWNTDRPHGFRFRVFYSTPNAFVIESEGWYGTITRRTRIRGEVESIYEFSYFSSRDLGDFIFPQNQTISGKVHANGNLFLRPSGSTLDFRTPSLTATGFIARTNDAWLRPDVSGIVNISAVSDSGALVEMLPGSPRGTQENAFDSFNPNWNSLTLGAQAKWGGVVRDRVPYKSPPPLESLEPNEYYHQLAASNGRVITSSSVMNDWCTQITNFYNYNEQRYQTVYEVDLALFASSGAWPPNGVIFSTVPVRFKNASTLQNKLLISSARNVYIKGNFNTLAQKGAAIMSMHRIYILSDNWDDALSTDSLNQPAADMQINAALIDGAPTVSEYNWVDMDGNNRYDHNNQLIYSEPRKKKPSEWNPPVNPTDPSPKTLNLLENWTGVNLHINGSIIHLGGSYDIMAANLNNSGITENQIAWVRRKGYFEPNYTTTYDTLLVQTATHPPYPPLVGHVTSWEPF